LSLLLELAVYGLLAYGTVHYFGLEVDWQKYAIQSRTSEYWLRNPRARVGPALLISLSFGSLHLPPVLPVAEDSDSAHCVARNGFPGLGAADHPLEVCALEWQWWDGGRVGAAFSSGLTILMLCFQVDPGARMATEAHCCSPTFCFGCYHSGLVLDQPGG
jgi:hypothetical protein